MVPCSAWVAQRSILLERILLNLVSNAVRYTSTGGVVLGCRRARTELRIEVCDTGIGIPEDQQATASSGSSTGFRRRGPARRWARPGPRHRRAPLSCCVNHSASCRQHGKGSRFSISVADRPERVSSEAVTPELPDRLLPGRAGRRDRRRSAGAGGNRGSARSLGCRVVAAESDRGGARSTRRQAGPDHLGFSSAGWRTGIDAIAQLRKASGGTFRPF